MSSPSSSSSTPEPSPSILKKKKRKEAPPVETENSDSDDSEAEPIPDEPVLSHAERRKQKRAAKKALEEENTSKKRKLTDGTAVAVASNTTTQRQNSVWVGNLSFKTTQQNIKTFFESAGEVTRINLPTKAPSAPGMKPENRGFAYVDFGTPEAKKAAIALSEQPLLGRKLLIKDGDDFAGRPAVEGAGDSANGASTSTTHSKSAQKILRVQKQPPAPTLFLGNLGFETTEKDIRQLFEAHRPVKKKTKEQPSADDDEEGKKKGQQDKDSDVWIRKIRMGTFEDTGNCKGFAFVDFTSVDHATTALTNPKNHQLNGRKLVVEYASAEAVRRGAPKEKRQDGDAPPPKKRDQTLNRREERPERPRDWDNSRHGAKSANYRKAEPDTAEVDVEEQSLRRAAAEVSIPSKERRFTKDPKWRPKPGAALAQAKRESAAILPSKGQKITF